VGRITQKVKLSTGSTRFWVTRSEYNSFKTGMNHRPRTHHTGLKRDIQRTSGQPVVTQGTTGFTHGHYFCVSCWVAQANILIPPPANDLAVLNDYSTNRNLALSRSLPGKDNGLIDPLPVFITEDNTGFNTHGLFPGFDIAWWYKS
jgi:hypothetical protein